MQKAAFHQGHSIVGWPIRLIVGKVQNPGIAQKKVILLLFPKEAVKLKFCFWLVGAESYRFGHMASNCEYENPIFLSFNVYIQKQ